jgi:hypothetical protein
MGNHEVISAKVFYRYLKEDLFRKYQSYKVTDEIVMKATLN